MKQLILPLLTVSYESRQLAKAFYTLNPINHNPGPYPRPEMPLTGSLHISLDQDIFMAGLGYSMEDYPFVSTEDQISYGYETKPIGHDDRNQPCAAVLAGPRRLIRSKLIWRMLLSATADRPLGHVLPSDWIRKTSGEAQNLWEIYIITVTISIKAYFDLRDGKPGRSAFTARAKGEETPT
ncbi:hypothetical protein F4818DRAFT_435714 [Hypoxylon cercidicola]|nr:hypothetical protein F4818DRAFT_435714 [Hypoxylon cercidicola]